MSTEMKAVFAQVQEICAANGAPAEKMLCTAKAQIIAIVGSNTLPQILPKELQIINSPEDTGTALTAVASNPAITVGVLTAVGEYLRARSSGDVYSTDVALTAYQSTVDEPSYRAGVIAALSLIDTQCQLEINAHIADSGLDADGFDALLKEVGDKPVEVMLEACTPIITFASQLVMCQIKTGDKELASTMYRVTGSMSCKFFDHIVEQLGGHMQQAVMKAALSPEVYEQVEAMLLAQAAKQANKLH